MNQFSLCIVKKQSLHYLGQKIHQSQLNPSDSNLFATLWIRIAFIHIGKEKHVSLP